MSTVSDIAKVSAKGSFHMLWGLIVSTLISSVGTIFIAPPYGFRPVWLIYDCFVCA